MSEWSAKRFWTVTEAVPADGHGFEIALDGRRVRTPNGTPLVLPTDALAQLVAIEWDAQSEKIDPSAMPMTRMANSAVDRIGTQRKEVVDYIAGYGATDLLCYRAQGPAALIDRQKKAWDPLLAWAEARYGERLRVTEGVMPVAQTPGSLAALRHAVEAEDDFGLMGLHDMVSLSGSLVLGLAATTSDFDSEALWQVSRIDELWQIEQWGEDSEASDVAERQAAAFRDAHRFFHAAR